MMDDDYKPIEGKKIYAISHESPGNFLMQVHVPARLLNHHAPPFCVYSGGTSFFTDREIVERVIRRLRQQDEEIKNRFGRERSVYSVVEFDLIDEEEFYNQIGCEERLDSGGIDEQEKEK